ncbi:P2X purinoceptor 7-like, partial [Paramuricea clavata]
ESHCDCKSSCSVKRKENGTRGCRCKGRNVECSDKCRCGTRDKPCKNRAMTENMGRERDNRSEKATDTRAKQGKEKGFRLSSKPTESEETQREKEHKDVKERQLNKRHDSHAGRLDKRNHSHWWTFCPFVSPDENFGEFGQASTEQPTGSALADSETKNKGPVPSDTHNPDQIDDSASGSVPDWCVCGRCHPMTQDVENKCCKLKKCITLSSRFAKLCLDPDVIELCIRNTGDIRNDREDNS